MPRPGPRPYECVKKAWHSELHKPMRGLVIQRILRIANEAHCTETKNNKEWQTKFPHVVMKAEQILYSKANSEAEYLDPGTLKKRLDDAINTIIRRDETETGKFIQPCIEAALVLGCYPVKESRSQQLKNPRRYLDLISEGTAQGAMKLSEDLIANIHMPPPPRPPRPSGNQISKSKKPNQANCSSPFNAQITPKTNNFGSVYPLYYVSNSLNVESGNGLESPQNPKPNNILLGTPIGWPIRQPAYVPRTMNLLPFENGESELSQFKPVDTHEKMAEKDCDLSLRLGPCLNPCRVMEKGFGFGDCLRNQQERERSQDVIKSFEFSFFPRCSSSAATDPSSHSCNDDMSETSRKRKALDLHDKFNSRGIPWLRDHQPGQFDMNT